MRNYVSSCGPLLEWILTIPIALGLAYATWFFFERGYLPQPYFYEPSGTFMDFFAVSSFAHNKDAFEVFGTIYPPLSFVVLKYFSWGPCYDFDGSEQVRSCDIYGISTIFVVFFVNSVLVYFSFRKHDASTSIPRSVALSFGFPMTYALERGNVLLFCFTCLVLAYGPLLRSAKWRWLFAGLVVNFKVYLVGTLFSQLLRRRWRWFEGAVLATVLVYLVTFSIYGEGTPKQLYDNITAYAGGAKGLTLLDLWYPSSFIPLRALLDGQAQFPIVEIAGSGLVDPVRIGVRLFVVATELSIIIAAATSWWRPTAVPMHRLLFLSVAMALITSEVSGYTHMLALFFVFMEKRRGFGRSTAIIIGYILCWGLELPLIWAPPVVRDSYLSGDAVIAEYALGLGSFLRPILFHALVMILAAVTVSDALADARSAGWKLPSVMRRGHRSDKANGSL